MHKPLAPCVKEQTFSVIRTMLARAARYDDAISLSIGEPDFHTPDFVSKAALADACAGHTHYAPSWGDADLREALLERIHSRHNVPAGTWKQENLLITCGAMHGLLASMRTMLDVGDEVLVPAPCFSDYVGHAGLARARLIMVPTFLEDGFQPVLQRLEEAVTGRTRILLINSPCNPTGTVLSPQCLDMLAEFACRHDLMVISDEVYNALAWQGEPESIVTRPGMPERTLVLNSFSKSHAMTGWRVGYAYGPAWLMEQMVKVLSYSVASTSTIGQRAALAALKGPDEPFAAMREAFGRRVRLAAQRLAAMPGVDVVAPAGAFYIFPRFSGVEDSTAFALDMLDATHVAAVPGSAFGPEESTRGCLRLACTVDEHKLATAFDRMETWLRRRHA